MEIVSDPLRIIAAKCIDEALELSGGVFSDLFRIKIHVSPFGADRELRIHDEKRRSVQLPGRIVKHLPDAGRYGGAPVQEKRHIRPERERKVGEFLARQFSVMPVQQPKHGGGVRAAAAHAGRDRNLFFDPDRPGRGDSGHVGIGQCGPPGQIFEIFRQPGEGGADPDSGRVDKIERNPVGRSVERQKQRLQLMIAVRPPLQNFQVKVDCRPGRNRECHDNTVNSARPACTGRI